jgi:glutamate-1-semialdehyde 2,1-aminomutase
MSSTAHALAARLAAAIPGGVNSNVRLEVADVVFAKGEGPRLWDVDGTEYLDYVLGQGPAFLGHANPRMTAAVTEAIQRGMTYGAQSTVEVAAAEGILRTLGWAEMVRIGMTSTETVQAALRVSRAATGRPLFLRFRGQYHGWLDNVLVSHLEPWPSPASPGQVPQALDESITIEWNDLAAVQHVFDTHPGRIAAIITEPVMLNAGSILPEPGFLVGLRDIATREGSVLIFDETITGFRIDRRGAVGAFGVIPDLAIYGKAVAGGFPASVLAGRADLMGLFANGVNHSGTFNANVLSCAAIAEAMAIMAEEDVHERVVRTGTALMDGIRNLLDEMDVAAQVRGLPAAFHLAFDTERPIRCYEDLLGTDAVRYRRFAGTSARDAGLWLATRGIWYVSASHDAATTAQTLDRLRVALNSFEDTPRLRQPAGTSVQT